MVRFVALCGLVLVGCQAKDSSDSGGLSVGDPQDSGTPTGTASGTATTAPDLDFVLVGNLPSPTTGISELMALRADGAWVALRHGHGGAWGVSADHRWVLYSGPHPDDPTLDVPVLRELNDVAVPIALTDARASVYDVAFSPDGQHVAVVADTDAGGAIWVLAVDGSAQVKLASANNTLNLELGHWNHDSTALTWTNTEGLYAGEIDGQRVRFLSSEPDDVDTAWQPGGDLLFYTTALGVELYDWAADAQVWQQIGSGQPHWSPEGATRTWMHYEGGFQEPLYFGPAPAGPGVVVDIGYDGARDATIRWADNGSRAIVTASFNGSWVVEADGTSVEIPRDDLWGFWSQGGQWNPSADTLVVSGEVAAQVAGLYTYRDGVRELLTSDFHYSSGQSWVGDEHLVHWTLDHSRIAITALPGAAGNPPAAAQALVDLEAGLRQGLPCGSIDTVVLMQVDPPQGYGLGWCGSTSVVCTEPALEGQTCIEGAEPLGVVVVARDPAWPLRLDTKYDQ